MEQVSVEQALRKAVTVVGRADLVAQLLEPLAVGGRDLGVDGVQERQGRQQVLTRRAFTAWVLTTSATRTPGGLVVRQRVQPSEQLTHQGELRGRVGKRDAVSAYRRHVEPTGDELDRLEGVMYIRALYLACFGYRRAVTNGSAFNEWGFVEPPGYFSSTAAAVRAAFRRGA